MQHRQLLPWNWFNNEHSQHLSSNTGQTSLSNAFGGHPLLRMNNEMEKLFNTFFPNTTLGAYNQVPGENLLNSSLAAVYRPQLDICENEENYTINMDIPGIEEKDVKIELNGDMLTVSGERSVEKDYTNNSFHQIERSYGKFQRILTLPADANKDHINAKFKNGVLKIELLKDPDQGGYRKQIQINT